MLRPLKFDNFQLSFKFGHRGSKYKQTVQPNWCHRVDSESNLCIKGGTDKILLFHHIHYHFCIKNWELTKTSYFSTATIKKKHTLALLATIFTWLFGSDLVCQSIGWPKIVKTKLRLSVRSLDPLGIEKRKKRQKI